MDTFGCTPKFIADNQGAVKALIDSYFDAVDMIKNDPTKSYEIMGADVKQTGEQFEHSADILRWQDQAANRRSSPVTSARSRRRQPVSCSRSASSSRSRSSKPRRHALHSVTASSMIACAIFRVEGNGWPWPVVAMPPGSLRRVSVADGSIAERMSGPPHGRGISLRADLAYGLGRPWTCSSLFVAA